MNKGRGIFLGGTREWVSLHGNRNGSMVATRVEDDEFSLCNDDNHETILSENESCEIYIIGCQSFGCHRCSV